MGSSPERLFLVVGVLFNVVRKGHHFTERCWTGKVSTYGSRSEVNKKVTFNRTEGKIIWILQITANLTSRNLCWLI